MQLTLDGGVAISFDLMGLTFEDGAPMNMDALTALHEALESVIQEETKPGRPGMGTMDGRYVPHQPLNNTKKQLHKPHNIVTLNEPSAEDPQSPATPLGSVFKNLTSSFANSPDQSPACSVPISMQKQHASLLALHHSGTLQSSFGTEPEPLETPEFYDIGRSQSGSGSDETEDEDLASSGGQSPTRSSATHQTPETDAFLPSGGSSIRSKPLEANGTVLAAVAEVAEASHLTTEAFDIHGAAAATLVTETAGVPNFLEATLSSSLAVGNVSHRHKQSTSGATTSAQVTGRASHSHSLGSDASTSAAAAAAAAAKLSGSGSRRVLAAAAKLAGSGSRKALSAAATAAAAVKDDLNRSIRVGFLQGKLKPINIVIMVSDWPLSCQKSVCGTRLTFEREGGRGLLLRHSRRSSCCSHFYVATQCVFVCLSTNVY